jgi:hypothetical protein
VSELQVRDYVLLPDLLSAIAMSDPSQKEYYNSDLIAFREYCVAAYDAEAGHLPFDRNCLRDFAASVALRDFEEPGAIEAFVQTQEAQDLRKMIAARSAIVIDIDRHEFPIAIIENVSDGTICRFDPGIGDDGTADLPFLKQVFRICRVLKRTCPDQCLLHERIINVFSAMAQYRYTQGEASVILCNLSTCQSFLDRAEGPLPAYAGKETPSIRCDEIPLDAVSSSMSGLYGSVQGLRRNEIVVLQDGSVRCIAIIGAPVPELMVDAVRGHCGLNRNLAANHFAISMTVQTCRPDGTFSTECAALFSRGPNT